MARPTRCRRICSEPEFDSFSPDGTESRDAVILTVDEFETVRLIDYEKKTHEQCAERMGISRTTVTETYERARSKIADCLVNGKTLRISGGHYKLCNGSARKCCQKKCRQASAVTRKEDFRMKIAVTYDNGKVFQHFGHSEAFKIYEVQDGQILNAQVIDTNGSGHGALAGLLSSLNVDILICGGIGGGAQNALAAAGIQLYGGVSGDADEAVKALLAGDLSYQADVKCSHHEHGEEHTCGENKHGCAGNGHCRG